MVLFLSEHPSLLLPSNEQKRVRLNDNNALCKNFIISQEELKRQIKSGRAFIKIKYSEIYEQSPDI